MLATAGLVSAGHFMGPGAWAQPGPSPGVPCLAMVQELAASPPDLQESLQSAASAFADNVHSASAPIEQAAGTDAGAVPGTLVTDVVSAAAAVPPLPVEAGVPAEAAPSAVVSEAAAVVAPPPAPAGGVVPVVPPVASPMAVPPVPVVGPVADTALPPPPPSVPILPAPELAPVPPALTPHLPEPVPHLPEPVPTAPAVEAAAVAPPPPAPPAPVAPIVEAAAAPPPIPAEAVVAEAGQLMATPHLTLPTVPGLPLQLPSELTMPRDLVCEGTAWSSDTP